MYSEKGARRKLRKAGQFFAPRGNSRQVAAVLLLHPSALGEMREGDLKMDAYRLGCSRRTLRRAKSYARRALAKKVQP